MNRSHEVKFTQLFINNEFVNSLSGKTYETKNPANNETIARVHEADKADVDRAVNACKQALKRHSQWRTVDASERGRTLHRLAYLLEKDIDYITSLETLNSGKPLKETQKEVKWACDLLHYYAGYADKIHGNTIPADGKVVAITRHEPIGICGLLLPWNLPFYNLCLKLAPALATGNTVIVKPAEQTPLTALYLAKLVKEAGFPPGVVNVLPGQGHVTGAALAEHMDVDMISFTGSTKVAKLVQMMAGKSNMKRVTLETVSKSPFVIFDDADIDWSAMTSHLSVFMSAGTACCTSTKIYVHEAIYDKFVHKCADLCKNRVLGDPFDNRTEQGPQIDEHQFNEVIQYIELGRKEGAKVLTGGKRWGNKGWYIEPTVLSDVTDNMQIAREEMTGPVMTILKFRTIDEVIDRINDSYYGLDAGVFTRDTDKALYFAQAVRTGNVWINHHISITPQIPFGGYKQSGVGREAGKDGLYEFTEVKSIVMKVDQKLS